MWQFVNSCWAGRSTIWDSECPVRGSSSPGLWLLPALSFVARAQELLNGHWMAGQQSPAREKAENARTTALVPSKTLLGNASLRRRLMALSLSLSLLPLLALFIVCLGRFLCARPTGIGAFLRFIGVVVSLL